MEEGNLWIRCTARLNQTLERIIEIAKHARTIMAAYPEVKTIISQSGRPNDGTDSARRRPHYWFSGYSVSPATAAGELFRSAMEAQGDRRR